MPSPESSLTFEGCGFQVVQEARVSRRLLRLGISSRRSTQTEPPGPDSLPAKSKPNSAVKAMHAIAAQLADMGEPSIAARLAGSLADLLHEVINYDAPMAGTALFLCCQDFGQGCFPCVSP